MADVASGGGATDPRSAPEGFEGDTQDGRKEDYLLWESKLALFWTRWFTRYVLLNDGCLSMYEWKSSVGKATPKTMELKADSVVFLHSVASLRCSFGVRTGDTEWLLTAGSETKKDAWIKAITEQIRVLFVREEGIPGDDRRSEGTSLLRRRRGPPSSETPL